MSWDDERAARAGLAWVFGGVNVDVQQGVDASSAASYLSIVKRLAGPGVRERAQLVDLDRLERNTEKFGMRFIIPGDGEWPAGLDGLNYVDGSPGAPLGLWVRGPGNLREWAAHSVAVVGSRAATHYGELATEHLVGELTDPFGGEQVIVSGGAYGIDAAAHRTAITNDGQTIGVYANGLDFSYPRGNMGLSETMCAQQLVVSEQPPGSGPDRQALLQRNRIIAALSQGTVVVEAALRSGALKTAEWATALGKPLMGVPGSILSATSAGVHRLLREGKAVPVTNAEQIRETILCHDAGQLFRGSPEQARTIEETLGLLEPVWFPEQIETENSMSL